MRPFELQLQADWPTQRWREVTVLAAVSGGADSVALLCGLAALHSNGAAAGAVDTVGQRDIADHPASRSLCDGPTVAGRLIAAHFHHGLRGTEADADQQFVVDLCARLGVECVVGKAAARDAQTRESQASEESSRDARYGFLIATAQRLGARYVAVAHTADDQAETVLHHIVRGAGLAGLGGMPRARELADGISLVRPMLSARRAAARAYLA